MPLLPQPDSILRAAILITPKQPFFDWINSIEPLDRMDDEMYEGELHLVPDYETKEEILRWLKKHYDLIFTEMLNGWYIDEDLWPQKRSFKMFGEWFQYSLHPMVWDWVAGPVGKV